MFPYDSLDEKNHKTTNLIKLFCKVGREGGREEPFVQARNISICIHNAALSSAAFATRAQAQNHNTWILYIDGPEPNNNTANTSEVQSWVH